MSKVRLARLDPYAYASTPAAANTPKRCCNARHNCITPSGMRPHWPAWTNLSASGTVDAAGRMN
ncbi:MAG: hypothetical protein ABJH63_02260 [Rhizobiaceae bacterium]